MRRTALVITAMLTTGLLATQVPALAPQPVEAQSAGCQFLTGGGPATFCDTFDAPQANPGRGGPMAPIWGVSRVTGNTNLSQTYENAWADTDIRMCDGSVKRVHSPDDLQICNGTLRESLNDTGENILAMYPRQPFDIAGRTGVVSFDVSDDSGGSHNAWPEFSFTDQPIPAPGTNPSAFPNDFRPRNSFNVMLSETNGTCFVTVTAWTTANWDQQFPNVVADGCIKPSPLNSFQMNHVEIRLSSTSFEVWMSDAGTRTMQKLAHGNVAMPLTRGLVWMKDAHYSADKGCPDTQPCEGMHTFAWDNFAFDGPVLPRDEGIQLPDTLVLTPWAGGPDNGYPVRQLGTVWNEGLGPMRTTLDFSGSHAVSNVGGASAALLEMTFDTPGTMTLNYAVNGHATHSQGGNPFVSNAQTIAMPVPVNELVNGDNHIDFWVTGVPVFGFSNVDLILVGAGDGGTNPPPATSTPVVGATATPVPATATPVVTPGRQFSRNLNRGDSIQVTCNGSALTTTSSSQTSQVLRCN